MALVRTAAPGHPAPHPGACPPARPRRSAARRRPPLATNASVSLPWPAATPAQVAGLQSAVDGGAQPWLLDPTQVALAYAAARGWPDATAMASAPTSVTVRSSAGTHVLTLAQPGKTGSAGIWVVTADR